MGGGLDEGNVEKKFRVLTGTQENIQSLALWVIHHKSHHEKVVDIWFQVLKKSQIPHRLVLFYLCNDIVQSCKRKHAVVYKDAFKEVLKDAVLLVKDASDVKPNIERIFNIWGERQVYEQDFVDELVAILNNTKVRATANSKLLAEFKPEVLIEKLGALGQLETEVQLRENHLTTLRLNSSNLEAVRHLKDKALGKEFTQQFEDCCVKLEEFVSKAEQEVEHRTALIELLEQSELFYDAQFGEAKIVANAYRNFGTRISNLQKRLEELKCRLPSTSFSPLPSPSMDAPSPENSPVKMEDDINAVDMEMSDDENSKKHMLSGMSSPPSINSAPSPEDSPIHVTGTTDISGSFNMAGSFLPGLTGGTFMTPDSDANTPGQSELGIPTIDSSKINVVQLTEGGGTPVKDEGSSTPVQDEHDQTHPPPDMNAAQSMASNPIEFLTQLINQGSKSGQGNSAFYQGLSALTQTVQSQFNRGGDVQQPVPQPIAPPSQPVPTEAWPPAWGTQHPPTQPNSQALYDPLVDTPAPAVSRPDAAAWPPPAVSSESAVQPWGTWQAQQGQPAVLAPVSVATLPSYPAPPSQPPSPQLTIPSTPPVVPTQHPPPGPPPSFMMNFSQPPPVLPAPPQQSPLPQPGLQPTTARTTGPLQSPEPHLAPGLQPTPKTSPSVDSTWTGYQPVFPTSQQATSPTADLTASSPHSSGPGEEYGGQNNLPSLMRPRTILRSSRTLTPVILSSEESEDAGSQVEEPDITGIPTITGSTRRHPRPPSQPPTPQNAPSLMSFRQGTSEGQQEFIEKLKRKSSLPGFSSPDTTPKPSFTRTLTAIPAEGDDLQQKSGDEAGSAAPSNGDGSGEPPVKSVGTSGGAGAGDSDIDKEDDGLSQEPSFLGCGGPPVRHNFEHGSFPHEPEHGLSHSEPRGHRRGSFDRRDPYFDTAPRRPRPYDDYGGPRGSRPYGRPYSRPPMVRPPHYYERGGHYPRY